jgi:flagellar motor switch protein FliM
MRMVVDVDTAFVDQTTYAEFIMSLSNPCCSYQFTLNPYGGQVIMDWAMPLVCAAVDRFNGGKGSSQGVEARQVSQVEMGIMAKVVRQAIWDLDRTWDPILHDRINNIELETNPEFMQVTAPSEIVILLAFEVNSTHASGLVSLCYPFFTLEPILPLLGRRDHDTRRRGDDPRRANRLRLGDMDLELAAELGRTRIPAAEAADLQSGDVIRLDSRADDPTCIYIGGRPKFLGWPLEEGGEVKLHLAGKIPPHLTHKYGTVVVD